MPAAPPVQGGQKQQNNNSNRNNKKKEEDALLARAQAEAAAARQEIEARAKGRKEAPQTPIRQKPDNTPNTGTKRPQSSSPEESKELKTTRQLYNDAPQHLAPGQRAIVHNMPRTLVEAIRANINDYTPAEVKVRERIMTRVTQALLKDQPQKEEKEIFEAEMSSKVFTNEEREAVSEIFNTILAQASGDEEYHLQHTLAFTGLPQGIRTQFEFPKLKDKHLQRARVTVLTLFTKVAEREGSVQQREVELSALLKFLATVTGDLEHIVTRREKEVIFKEIQKEKDLLAGKTIDPFLLPLPASPTTSSQKDVLTPPLSMQQSKEASPTSQTDQPVPAHSSPEAANPDSTWATTTSQNLQPIDRALWEKSNAMAIAHNRTATKNDIVHFVRLGKEAAAALGVSDQPYCPSGSAKLQTPYFASRCEHHYNTITAAFQDERPHVRSKLLHCNHAVYAQDAGNQPIIIVNPGMRKDTTFENRTKSITSTFANKIQLPIPEIRSNQWLVQALSEEDLPSRTKVNKWSKSGFICGQTLTPPPPKTLAFPMARLIEGSHLNHHMQLRLDGITMKGQPRVTGLRREDAFAIAQVILEYSTVQYAYFTNPTTIRVAFTSPEARFTVPPAISADIQTQLGRLWKFVGAWKLEEAVAKRDRQQQPREGEPRQEREDKAVVIKGLHGEPMPSEVSEIICNALKITPKICTDMDVFGLAESEAAAIQLHHLIISDKYIVLSTKQQRKEREAWDDKMQSLHASVPMNNTNAST